MLHYPGFNPVAFEIGPIFGFGPLQVRWYGIMYLIGFGAAWMLARWRASRPQSTWKANDVDDVVFYAMLGVINHLVRELIHVRGEDPGDVADAAVAFCLGGVLATRGPSAPA